MATHEALRLSVASLGLSVPDDPGSILGASLVGLFDPGVMSSLWTTDGMSQAVINDGDPVGRWRDLTTYGNDWHQTQIGSPDFRPVWKATGLNNRPSVRFSGGQLLTMLDSASYKNNTIWCMMALSCKSSGTVIMGYSYAATHISPWFDWLMYNQPSLVETRMQATVVDVSIASDLGNSAIISYGNATGNFYEANTLQGVGASGSVVYTNPTGMKLGAHLNGTGIGEAMTGDFGPILIASAEPSAAQQLALYNWMRRKTGL